MYILNVGDDVLTFRSYGQAAQYKTANRLGIQCMIECILTFDQGSDLVIMCEKQDKERSR